LEQPLRLLDLGCGDARLIPALLDRLEVELYEGVDSSEPALERAQANLAGLPARLTRADLLARVSQDGPPFTLGMASYSAHHLRPEQRPAFYSRLKSLAPCWFFLDVMRPDQDTREAFNARLLERSRHDWASLTQEEYALVHEHIQTSDYPISRAELLALTEPHGFRLDILWSDPVATGKLFRLQR
jgi:trans-aconitate methyltransferase